MTKINAARVAVGAALLAVAWWLGSVIDPWGPALAAMLPPELLGEWLLYVAWKERRAA
jgi:hypothetical protein|nr:MAG TPA: hypothetical protein [Caudoviricetes sp.]